MARVSYSKVTHVATELLASMERDYPWNLEIFNNRDEAFSWLVSKQG